MAEIACDRLSGSAKRGAGLSDGPERELRSTSRTRAAALGAIPVGSSPSPCRFELLSHRPSTHTYCETRQNTTIPETLFRGTAWFGPCPTAGNPAPLFRAMRKARPSSPPVQANASCLRVQVTSTSGSLRCRQRPIGIVTVTARWAIFGHLAPWYLSGPPASRHAGGDRRGGRDQAVSSHGACPPAAADGGLDGHAEERKSQPILRAAVASTGLLVLPTRPAERALDGHEPSLSPPDVLGWLYTVTCSWLPAS
jgi:hypothetical protein